MPHSIDIWKLLAGIAIFLLGMRFIEESLQQMTGRGFKLFLKKQTTSKPKAILGGVVVTGILQSSSVVNLMVLAFVGAGVIQMQNALAVALGANLGTTVSNWIVATVGFSMNIDYIALPLVGIAGILMYLSRAGGKLRQWTKFLLGIGFLFYGLGFIRSGMEESVKEIDLTMINQYPAIVFLLLGFVFTAIIQSSSVTLAITLSALYANAITLYSATAIALGAEVGTTIKFLLAAVHGLPAKKRVALGNFLINIVLAILVFIFLWPVNHFITGWLQIKDKLIALVFFQSLVNLLSIILFYPFLESFGRFLEKRFITKDGEPLYIGKVKPVDTEPALIALENDIRYFILCALDFTTTAFSLPGNEQLQSHLHKNYLQKNLAERYEYLKKIHGELYGYAIQVQNNKNTDETISRQLQQLISSNRNTMYAVKSIKDALPDISQLSNSANDLKYDFYSQAAVNAEGFCKNIYAIIGLAKMEAAFPQLNKVYSLVSESYASILHQLYKENWHAKLTEVEISTLINFNREMYTAYKSFVFALKDFGLDAGHASYFDDLPGFIR